MAEKENSCSEGKGASEVEDEAQAMIKEYSANEIHINSLEVSRITSASSRAGPSMVIPQVVYTPPRIIIKKASTGGKYFEGENFTKKRKKKIVKIYNLSCFYSIEAAFCRQRGGESSRPDVFLSSSFAVFGAFKN